MKAQRTIYVCKCVLHTIKTSFILVRASFGRSYLLLVKSNWTEISELCFLALYTFVLGIKPLNLTITC